MDKIYKVGDKVWIVPGYRSNYLIAIEVSITAVDDELRKKYPGAIIFYDVDEPIGHCLDDSDFFTKEQAKLELINRYDSELQHGTLPEFNLTHRAIKDATLERFRAESVNFIVDTWARPQYKEHDVKELLASFPAKERSSWFNVNDISKEV